MYTSDSMSDDSNITPVGEGKNLRRCPSCHHEAPHDAPNCPECGYPMGMLTRVLESSTSTRRLERIPVTMPRDDDKITHLPEHASVILQFLPSGTCVNLPLEEPMILGRGQTATPHKILDLSGFNAMRHGVSRQHCKLERRDDKLIITDVGSSNGTHLNHESLLPHREYAIAHGDQLVLGTLHLFVAFSSIE